MALFIHNLGVFAKLFSEAVEAVDPRPVEGIRVTGAVRVQEVIFGGMLAFSMTVSPHSTVTMASDIGKRAPVPNT
jgi:ABC-type phosphate/phosphonate transport system permease subunit